MISRDASVADVVNRDQFWKALSPLGLPQSNANRLFSSFDINRTGEVDYRAVIASLRLLRRPNEDSTSKIMGAWLGFGDGGERMRERERESNLRNLLVAHLCDIDSLSSVVSVYPAGMFKFFYSSEPDGKVSRAEALNCLQVRVAVALLLTRRCWGVSC